MHTEIAENRLLLTQLQQQKLGYYKVFFFFF